MATINLSENNDVIIPTNDDTTYRGLREMILIYWFLKKIHLQFL